MFVLWKNIQILDLRKYILVKNVLSAHSRKLIFAKYTFVTSRNEIKQLWRVTFKCSFSEWFPVVPKYCCSESFGRIWLDKLIVRLQQGCFSTGVKVWDILQTASPKFQNKAFSGHLQCLPHYECFIPGFASDNYCIYKPIILKLACLIGVSCIEYVINWAKWFWCWWFFGANYLAMKTLSDI